MNIRRILAGALAATLILCLAFSPGPLPAQVVPVESLAGEPGCGGAAGLAAGGETAIQEAHIGDLNGDSFVDVVDLLIFVETFGKLEGAPGFNAEADFNCDGSIDVVDLLTFVGNFGT